MISPNSHRPEDFFTINMMIKTHKTRQVAFVTKKSMVLKVFKAFYNQILYVTARQ